MRALDPRVGIELELGVCSCQISHLCVAAGEGKNPRLRTHGRSLGHPNTFDQVTADPALFLSLSIALYRLRLGCYLRHRFVDFATVFDNILAESVSSRHFMALESLLSRPSDLALTRQEDDISLSHCFCPCVASLGDRSCLCRHCDVIFVDFSVVIRAESFPSKFHLMDQFPGLLLRSLLGLGMRNPFCILGKKKSRI